MKRLIFVLFAILPIFSIYADSQPIDLDFGGNIEEEIKRTPMHLPIEVIFDNTTCISLALSPRI